MNWTAHLVTERYEPWDRRYRRTSIKVRPGDAARIREWAERHKRPGVRVTVEYDVEPGG